jgi:hypothetical protein
MENSTISKIIRGDEVNQLATLDKARIMLAEARTLPEVKKIRDIAEAAKVYAKAAHLGREAQNYAAEISLLASCKAGEILKQLERRQGQRTDKELPAGAAGRSEYAQTLKDTETTVRTAHLWQNMANIPEETRNTYVMSMHESDGEITASGLLRAGRPHIEKRKNRNEPVDDFEDVRKAALKMLSLGHVELRKTNANYSLLDSAKTWAQSKLENRD